MSWDCNLVYAKPPVAIKEVIIGNYALGKAILISTIIAYHYNIGVYLVLITNKAFRILGIEFRTL
jgi:hypothetical protein